MAEIVRQQSGNREVVVGCFTVKGEKMNLTRPALYVCTDLMSNSPISFWFHYNWSHKPKSSKRVNQVKSMSYKSSRSVMLQFEKGGEGNLSLLTEIPDWLNGWKHKEFNPKTSCSFRKDSNNSYSLTCSSLNKATFTQTINSSDFHKPTKLKINA